MPYAEIGLSGSSDQCSRLMLVSGVGSAAANRAKTQEVHDHTTYYDECEAVNLPLTFILYQTVRDGRNCKHYDQKILSH